MKTRILKCCICNKEIKGYGNNPAPIKFNGRCCDSCNQMVVIERYRLIIGKPVSVREVRQSKIA